MKWPCLLSLLNDVLMCIWASQQNYFEPAKIVCRTEIYIGSVNRQSKFHRKKNIFKEKHNLIWTFLSE